MQDKPRTGSQPTPIAGILLAGVLVSGMICIAVTLAGREVNWGSRHVTFRDDGVSSTALAERAIELRVIDTIAPEELRGITSMLRAKASEGDPRAALFVFEVARLQAEAAAEGAKQAQ